MPTDEASRTIEVAAGFDDVMTVIRDVESQVEWIPEILEAQLLEEAAPVGTDEYTLEYEHSDDGMTWSLVSGRLQTGQDGTYAVQPVDDDTTTVTYTLRISHHLPLPGFVRNRVIKGLVENTVNGLKTYLEQPPEE